MSEKKVKEAKKAEIIELEERRKEMKFTGQQRLVLLTMMPREGEYFNIKKMRMVKEALGLNDIEQKIFESSSVMFPGGTITNWDSVNSKIPRKAIDVGEWIGNHLRHELKKQFDEKKLREDTIDLYDMFCGVPESC